MTGRGRGRVFSTGSGSIREGAADREAQADDLGGVYASPASPDADLITAQTLLVDGGAHQL